MANTSNTGQATTMIPASARTIIAINSIAKISKHKVIILMPPFYYRNCKKSEKGRGYASSFLNFLPQYGQYLQLNIT